MPVDPMTYEKGNADTSLETYEWDNVWWERTENVTAKRILYIGDSISYGTRQIATATAKEELLFDGFATSKALDNPYYIPTLEIFMAQQPRRDAILFNNGLHGWHLDEETTYRENYRKAVRFLLEKGSAPIWILLTTDDASDPERNRRVLRRNEIAREIAAEFGLPVIDLYEVVTSVDLHGPDGIHFTQDGYQRIADCLVATLKEHFGM